MASAPTRRLFHACRADTSGCPCKLFQAWQGANSGRKAEMGAALTTRNRRSRSSLSSSRSPSGSRLACTCRCRQDCQVGPSNECAAISRMPLHQTLPPTAVAGGRRRRRCCCVPPAAADDRMSCAACVPPQKGLVKLPSAGPSVERRACSAAHAGRSCATFVAMSGMYASDLGASGGQRWHSRQARRQPPAAQRQRRHGCIRLLGSCNKPQGSILAEFSQQQTYCVCIEVVYRDVCRGSQPYCTQEPLIRMPPATHQPNTRSSATAKESLTPWSANPSSQNVTTQVQGVRSMPAGRL